MLAAYFLLSPDAVFSREMTWDLLFNLEGAWDLYQGQVFHVDVHDPLGVLPFLLTEIGFWIAGIGPQAFIAGTMLYAGFIFVAAIFVLAPRLPMGAAVIALLYLTVLVLVPVNIGDDPSIYTFAMSYNRFGWSGIVLLFMLLVLAPHRDRARNGGDALIGLILLLALFYLKITYFLAGTGAVIAALWLSPHVRAQRRRWLLALAATAAVAAAPINVAYWSDIWAAVTSGAVRRDALGLVRSALLYETETTLLLVQFLCLFYLWRAGRVAGHDLVMALFAAISGLLLLSQNAQIGSVPLFAVISFMVFKGMCRAALQMNWRQDAGVMLLLIASLTPPALATASMGLSLAGYWTKAMAPTGNMLVGDTNLRGLAVPAASGDLLEAFSHGQVAPETLIAVRREHPRWELTQPEYLQILLEAVSIFRSDPDGERFGTAPKIMLFDGVNPLPFVLGLAPPRGINLWFDPLFHWPAAPEALRDVDVVLIPKFFSTTTEEALARYGGYLRQHFTADGETASWVIYRRAAADRALVDRN